MPPPPPDSVPQDPAAIRLSALERGLESLSSRCDDLARLLNQLLESARLASQRRSNLMSEIEALRTRVGALEEGQTGAARNLREIIERLATTVPVQTQLDQFSSDLAGLSATLNREFSALSPRLNVLEAAQVKTTDRVALLQQQLQASGPGQAQLDEMQSALRELSANLANVSNPSATETAHEARLSKIEGRIEEMAPAFQQMGRVCLELQNLLNP